MGSPRSAVHALLLFGLVLAVAGIALHLGAPGRTLADPSPDSVSVIDGDTIQVGAQVVQLYGIDAPELGQRCLDDGDWTHCGLLAAFELNKLIGVGRGKVECTPPRGSEDSGTQICRVGRINLAHALLVGGYVVAGRDTGPDYLEAEDSARQGALGLWHMEFTHPADWLAGERLPEEPGPEEAECPVKAMVGAAQGRVYIVPTDSAYRTARLDPARGDRSFCSDEDARAAGWRRPGERPSRAGTG